MQWIVKIEKFENQRIKIIFDPLNDLIYFYGEYKPHNQKWVIFSEDSHNIKINLEQLQEKMEIVVSKMKERIIEYDNLAKGFTVLKWIAYEEETDLN